MTQRTNFKTFERLLVYFTGVGFLITILVLVIKFPYPTTAQINVFRTIIALAGGGFGVLLPGALQINTPFKGYPVKAAGAVAIFVLLYTVNPATLVSQPVNTIKPAAGLAYGYYFNYLNNVIPKLNEDDKFSFIDVEKKDTIEKVLQDFKFYICVPKSPQLAQLEYVKNISKKYVHPVYLDMPKVNRKYSMFIPRDLKNSKSPVFLDIPSAVSIISEYADFIVNENGKIDKEKIISEELLVFKQTLKQLFEQNALLKDKCEIVDIDPKANQNEVEIFFDKFSAAKK